MVSPVIDEFNAVLTKIPLPTQWSYSSIVDSLRKSPNGVEVVRKYVRSEVRLFILSSEFFVTVSTYDPTVVSISCNNPDMAGRTALAEAAKKYARQNKVSLEQYFFRTQVQLCSHSIPSLTQDRWVPTFPVQCSPV